MVGNHLPIDLHSTLDSDEMASENLQDQGATESSLEFSIKCIKLMREN